MSRLLWVGRIARSAEAFGNRARCSIWLLQIDSVFKVRKLSCRFVSSPAAACANNNMRSEIGCASRLWRPRRHAGIYLVLPLNHWGHPANPHKFSKNHFIRACNPGVSPVPGRRRRSERLGASQRRHRASRRLRVQVRAATTKAGASLPRPQVIRADSQANRWVVRASCSSPQEQNRSKLDAAPSRSSRRK